MALLEEVCRWWQALKFRDACGISISLLLMVAGVESSQVPPHVPATIPSLCHRAEDSTPLEPETQLNPFFYELS